MDAVWLQGSKPKAHISARGFAHPPGMGMDINLLGNFSCSLFLLLGGPRKGNPSRRRGSRTVPGCSSGA